MATFEQPISEMIWDMKYRFKDERGNPIDLTVEDTWDRIAADLASAEDVSQRPAQQGRFLRALEDFKYLPAGRIQAGAGTGRDVTLFNCFVMGTIPDSLDGIFSMLKEAALTMQQGGGIGYDFSTLRPKGALVRGVAADASGPLSFMDVWDTMCKTIMSAGARRGAMMATIRCDHPDIRDFIEAKRDPNRLRNFNLSVLATDPFMEAVKNDEDWPLVFDEKVYETVRAVDLWNEIMRATYDVADPGVIFIDRINAENNLHYCETIAATNPCGEQPLPAYGACLLGSINVAAFVRRPFARVQHKKKPVLPHIDMNALRDTVRTAVRMMDNVVDVSKFPLEAQRKEAGAKRRLGLGITGLASALAMMQVPYGSAKAVELTENITREIAIAAYWESVELAKEKGPFPLFDADEFLKSKMVQRLPDGLKEAIRKYGIRNSHLTSIAPTGTISLFAGNLSSGIEPIFASYYDRKVRQRDGSKTEERVYDYAVLRYIEHCDVDDFNPETELPDYFVTAQTLSPADHIRMQAAAQNWVDSSISKTVNCPEDISFEDFKAVYMLAYESGCKGCTTYRPNEVTGSVISVAKEEKSSQSLAEEIEALRRQVKAFLDVAGRVSKRKLKACQGKLKELGVPNVSSIQTIEQAHALRDFMANFDTPGSAPETQASAEPVLSAQADLAKRPECLDGKTYKLKFAGEQHAFYITITDTIEGGFRRPFEVFINSKGVDHYAWMVGLTRMISAIFRRGGDVAFVAEELKAVFDPKGGMWHKGKYVPSVLAGIGSIIEQHMREIGYLDCETPVVSAEPEGHKVPAETVSAPRLFCPQCGSANVALQEGCLTCHDCGYSKCG